MSRPRSPRSSRPGAVGPRLGAAARLLAVGGLLALVGVVLLRSGTGAGAPAASAAGAWKWDLPKGFPAPRVPRDNPMTKQKVALGRFLFYERKLSGNGTQSCGSCHHQGKAFTDGLARAVGSTGQVHPRSSMTLGNVAYNATLTWANPSLVSLERQMEVVIFGDQPVEFGVTDRNRRAVLARLKRTPRYRAMFRAAFPAVRGPITWGNVIKSIASFERTMITGRSRYDRVLDGTARLTGSERRGADLFFGERAECHHCHSSVNFNDQLTYAGSRNGPRPFHNTGLYNLGGTGAYPEPNTGVFSLTARASDMGRFRAPSLRNVGVTAPYMHDGSIATLEEVVATYAAGGRNIAAGPFAGDGRANPFKDPLIATIALTPQEQQDIVAFLRTLTDRRFLSDRRLSDPFPRTGR